MSSLGLARIGIDALQDKGTDHVPNHPSVWADEFAQVSSHVMEENPQPDLCFVYKLTCKLRVGHSHCGLRAIIRLCQLTHGCVANLQADAQRRRWADEFSQQPENQWASEFERTQTGAAASISGTDSQTDAATRGDTKALADLLSSDANPKMKNSKFLQFISKMSRGEIILEDNEVG